MDKKLKLEDFDGIKIPSDWNGLDVLSHVALKDAEKNGIVFNTTTTTTTQVVPPRCWAVTGKRKPRPHRDDNDVQEVPQKKPKCNNKITFTIPRNNRVAIGYDNGPQPAPLLSEEFKKAVLELSGASGNQSDAMIINHSLVIEKTLTQTDISAGQNRFSIPLKKMSCGDFLNEEEKDFLCTRDCKGNLNYMEVKIIEPSRRQGNVKLSRWEMKKESGSPSVSYVLNGTWNKIVSSNNLKQGMNMQLWASRIEGVLYLSLVRVP